MRRLAYGPAAWLLDGVDDPAALGRAIAAAGLDGIDDVVPAESTVLVRCTAATAPRVGSRLDSIVPLPVDAVDQEPLIIDVVYDGVDLADVARSVDLGVDDVIERHLAAVYSVAFCGFSPGFGYLRGLDPVLHLDGAPRPAHGYPADRLRSRRGTARSTRRRRRADGICSARPRRRSGTIRPILPR